MIGNSNRIQSVEPKVALIKTGMVVFKSGATACIRSTSRLKKMRYHPGSILEVSSDEQIFDYLILSYLYNFGLNEELIIFLKQFTNLVHSNFNRCTS